MSNQVGRPRVYSSNAERVKAFRNRKGVKRFTVEVSSDTFDKLEKWLEFKDYTKSQIVEKLINDQLFRRR